MSKCCIGLCVKDSEEGLQHVLCNVNLIRQCFEKIRIIVAYDESTDKSSNILLNYKKNHDDMVILEINNKTVNDYKYKWEHHIYRSQRIANARNEIVKYIEKYHSQDKYFIMMDTNNYSCVSPIDINVFNKVLLQSNEWDGLSFNRDPYYDMWAVSLPPLVLSCWHFYKGDKAVNTVRKYITDKLGRLKPDEFLPVMSAFNGFAIYKTEKFLNCRYSGKFDIKIFSEESIRKQAKILDSKLILRPNDCEHRSFHIDAIKKNNARIMISPLYLFPQAKDYDNNL